MKMDKVKELTECSICIESFVDPRILPCVHTFCFRCIDDIRWKSEKNPGDKMPCPICRTEFVIPPEGLTGIKKNFFMERLLELAQTSEPPQKSTACMVCLADAKRSSSSSEAVSMATKYCAECQENMCESCSREHTRHKFGRGHQVIAFGSRTMVEPVKALATHFCDQHDEKEVELYCVDCKQLICVICLIESHQVHSCSDTNRMADEFRKRIENDAVRLNESSVALLTRMGKIKEKKVEFLEEIECTEKSINDRANKLKELVDRHAVHLLEELAVTKQEKIKEMDIGVEEIETQLVAVKSFNAYCTALKSKGSPVDVCRSIYALQCRADELDQSCKAQIQRRLPSIRLNFEVSKVEECAKNVVGQIKTVQLRNKKKDESQCFSTVRRLSTASACICGVTTVGDYIYVLSLSPSMIHVFENREPFGCLMDVDMKEIRSPWDIASCEKSGCLYITDRAGDACIWKTSAAQHEIHRVTRWLLHVSSPFTLSVSHNGDVLILRQGEPSELKIYASEDNSLTLQLARDIQSPIHAVQTPAGSFIISHQWKRTGDERNLWVLSQLNSGGDLIGRFIPTEPLQELKKPYHLALDSDAELLFVTDYSNNRVVTFDSNSLDWKQVIMTQVENGIQMPLRLCFDGNTRQLLVGLYGIGKGVYIYDSN